MLTAIFNFLLEKKECILFNYIAFVYWTGHVGFQLMDTGSNPVRDANYAVVVLWEGNGLSIRLRRVRFSSTAPNLFREIQARCRDLTVNQWLGEFDPHTRSQTIWGQ